jgi:hypothetical protein
MLIHHDAPGRVNHVIVSQLKTYGKEIICQIDFFNVTRYNKIKRLPFTSR